MIFTCTFCKDRSVGCHSTCEAYKRDLEKRDRIRKGVEQERLIRDYNIDKQRRGGPAGYTTRKVKI
jgi:hypothetical protein